MKTLLMLAVLSCVSLVEAQTTPAQSGFEAAIALAQTSEEAGDHATARMRLQAALPLAKTKDDKVRILLGIGRTYSAEKRFELARVEWGNALVLDGLAPNDQYALHLVIGSSYADEGDFARALRELRLLLQASGASEQEKIGLRLTLAGVAVNAHEVAQAKVWLTDVVQNRAADEGSNAFAWMQLGNLALQEKDYATVRAAFGRILDFKGVGPDIHAAAQATIAQSYKDEGDTKNFQIEGEKARFLWMQVGAAYSKAKQGTQARTAYQQALAVDPQDGKWAATLRLAIGEQFLQAGKPVEAQKEFEMVLQLKADPALDANALANFKLLQQTAQLSLARSFRMEKNYAQARQTLNTLLQTEALDAAMKTFAESQLRGLNELEKMTP